MSVYSTYKQELSVLNNGIHPSELHGLLVGYLCAVKASSEKGQRQALYSDWLGGSVPDRLLDLLEAAQAQVLEDLDEYADFGFRVLLPDDESALADRAEALGLWCSGFLSGYGGSGRLSGGLSENVEEALADLGRIAAMSDEVPEGEENEADLTEIEEFVRISTLLIFAETGDAGAH
jgi:uncharacterized protein YgfB (UPF0149 family)